MSLTSRRAGLGGAVAALAVLGLAVPAWAYFSVPTSAGTAAGRAATLGTPSVATSGVSASSVTFTVAAPTEGPVPTGYRVARTSPSAVATVCTVTGASGSCTDTAPVAGQTNAYAVYAVLAGSTWESPVPATTSVVVPSADTTAPVTSASTSPAPNGAGWSSSDVVVTLTATDASGVAGTWYTTDGSTPTTASTAYTGAFGLTSSATVRFFSKDTVGNTETPRSLSVQVDKVAPVAAVTSPAAGTTQGGAVAVSGTATDVGSGVSVVTVQYQAAGAQTWTAIGNPAVASGAWTTSWATAGLVDGSYSLQVVVTDLAGNTTTSTPVAVTLKNTFTVSGVPATATAGTPFTITLSTYPGYTGSRTLAISGAASPSGAQPNVTTPVTFANGSAQVSVTLPASGIQSFTIRDAVVTSLAGDSTSVTVTAGAASRVALTGVTGAQSTSSCFVTVCTYTNVGNGTFTAAATLVDAGGNAVAASGTTTVTFTGSTGGTNKSVTIPAGATTSSTKFTFTGPNNGTWNRDWSVSYSGGTSTVTLNLAGK